MLNEQLSKSLWHNNFTTFITESKVKNEIQSIDSVDEEWKWLESFKSENQNASPASSFKYSDKEN